MRILTLTQPWATLIACGAKRIETRSWTTGYRGPIAIHAAKGLGPVGGKRGLQGQCAEAPFCHALEEWFERCGAMKSPIAAAWAMPLGAIVATADLVDIQPTSMEMRARLLSQTVTPWELNFGNYTSGRFAWLLEKVRPLPKPLEYKGSLGLGLINARTEQIIANSFLLTPATGAVLLTQ